MSEVETVTSYVCTLDKDQIAELRSYLQDKGYQFRDVKYAHFGAFNKDLSLTAYHNGKMLVQGRGTADFVRYYLEPQLLKEIKFGYEYLLEGQCNLEERIGVDESGKGDYFGPLVIAGVFASRNDIRTLHDMGVRDSKLLSETRVIRLMQALGAKLKDQVSVVIIGPEKYNLLFDRMHNLNKMLAWGHARVIENLLSRIPCKKVIVDQFADASLVRNALMKKGRRVDLEARPRAEADVVVAAASILARGKFITRLHDLGEEFKTTFPRGVSQAVIDRGRQFIEERGIQQLAKVAKLHFRTTQKVIGVAADA